MTPFRLLLRVRYQECDAQGIVFNARWGEYVDLAVSEYTRVLFGSTDPKVTGLDWRLVKQTTEWRAPARFDDVLDLQVRTVGLGTTSFTLAVSIDRFTDRRHLADVETVYVLTDEHGAKQAISDPVRASLERGAPGVVVDHAAAGSITSPG